VWIYIHRQRKEWDAREKEMVAYRLVELSGKASAANILGVSLRELEKLIEVFELSQRFTKLRDPNAAITWARELNGLSRKLLTPSVIDAVVTKVNEQRITNSKDLRKLRTIVPDPVARDHFLNAQGDIESAMLRVASVKKPSEGGLPAELDAVMETVKKIPWTELQELKGDIELLRKIDAAETMLKSLKKALS
jgi:ParB family chromosome partitioning protein